MEQDMAYGEPDPDAIIRKIFLASVAGALAFAAGALLLVW